MRQTVESTQGDGTTDDSDAINRALSQGRDLKAKLTTQPAVVYLPPGTYLVSKTLQMAFYTFIHGNPKCRPLLKYTGAAIGIGGPPSCNKCLHVNDFFYGGTGRMASDSQHTTSWHLRFKPLDPS